MLSASSLAAFSAATTTPVGNTGAIRLVRDATQPPREPPARSAAPLPTQMPREILPRGSLLDLNV